MMQENDRHGDQEAYDNENGDGMDGEMQDHFGGGIDQHHLHPEID